MKDRADIFVLIVGARYGTQDEAGKSITNREYLEARAKGIPIYVFLLKSIQHALPIWQNNREGNYVKIVDTPKLFEFAESLRDAKEHWVYSFETAQDIIEILRQQFAYLFMDALAWREQLKVAKLTPLLSELAGDSLRIALEKPVSWEHRLFCAVFHDELTRAQALKWDSNYKLQLEKPIEIKTTKEFVEWVWPRTMQIPRFVSSAQDLIERAFVEAMQPAGIPANPEHQVYVARRLGSVYRATLQWKIDFHSISPDPNFERACVLSVEYAANVLQGFEQFAPELEAMIEAGLEAKRTGKPFSGVVNLRFNFPINHELSVELERLRHELVL